MTALPSPSNISWLWNGGSILGLLLGVQITTGLFLSIHYAPHIDTAFASVVHIVRDIPGGWLLRRLHANGASLFFVFLYIHIGRGLYYQSYLIHPRTWAVGVLIFLLSIGTAFLGYVLPWGQISFWGATVITNLLSAIPYIGAHLVEWVWGGFSVGQATLNRFFTLHFIMPFTIAGAVLLHLIFLHQKGSRNPLGNLRHVSKVPFHPYFTVKDLVGFIGVVLVLLAISFFAPTGLTDPENFIIANPIVTPTHIQPEWYFLFAYAILRSIPSKLGGVVALVISIIILFFLPLGGRSLSSRASFNIFNNIISWTLVITFIVLTWLGACAIEAPFTQLAPPFTILYFILYILLLISNSWHYKLLML